MELFNKILKYYEDLKPLKKYKPKTLIWFEYLIIILKKSL